MGILAEGRRLDATFTKQALHRVLPPWLESPSEAPSSKHCLSLTSDCGRTSFF